MAANAPVTKPSVLWLALLILVGGALVLIAGLTLLTLGSITLPQGVGIKQTLNRAIPYIGVVLGTVDIVAGVLILKYKRLGLYLAGASFGAAVLLLVYNVVTENATIGGAALGLLIDLAVLYFVYRYLTHEPHKSFFT